jgi:hypothetical protein
MCVFSFKEKEYSFGAITIQQIFLFHLKEIFIDFFFFFFKYGSFFFSFCFSFCFFLTSIFFSFKNSSVEVQFSFFSYFATNCDAYFFL